MPQDSLTTASLPTQVEQHGLPPTIGLGFSKDRAMQLDAMLRSLLLQCEDYRNLELHILYNASEDRWRQQYLILEHYWCTRLPVIFHAEQDFRTDVLSILGLPDRSGAPTTLLRKGLLGRASRLLHRIPVAPAPWEHVLFLVDDNLFVRPFSLSDIVSALRAHPRAVGFSLRLGRNTTYCYSLDRQQAPPAFSPIGNNLLTFNWTTAECDFGYPLEVSSSVYAAHTLAGLLAHERYSNPNTLEAKLSAKASSVRRLRGRTQLLCFDESVAFCNAVNKVQTTFGNRSGSSPTLSAAALGMRFDEGLRIDIDALSGYRPSACHCSVPFTFVPE